MNPPLSTGSPELDDLMGGGLEPKIITQVYGEPASGKSTVCILSSVSALRGGSGVIFLDSEGFSAERFRQVAGERAMDLARNLFLYEPHDFSQQAVMVRAMDTLLREGGIGLIVVDSATGLYRSQLEKGKDALQRLATQVIQLLGYARRYEVPVLISNQVYMDPGRNQFVGLGGTALEHLSKVIVRLERVDSARRATLVKHRSRPAGASFDFTITQTGISPLALPDPPGKQDI
jgi:DNA repair protein RadB